MENRSTKVASTSAPVTQGSPWMRICRKSNWLAAWPVIQASAGASRARIEATARSAVVEDASPSRSR